jgi:hypothetical protein
MIPEFDAMVFFEHLVAGHDDLILVRLYLLLPPLECFFG